MPLTKIKSLGITDGTITSTNILDGTIVNADINASAAIVGTKLSGVNDAKAWVNFNGTGTVAIRASFNVTSITDNNTGDYTVNFTNAISDANYAVVGTSGSAGNNPASLGTLATNTSSVQVVSNQHNSGNVDRSFIMVAIFR